GLGYGVFTSDPASEDAWERLLQGVQAVGGEPAGRAARDTLRLEMGYPLHGSDIDPRTTPAEAGLMWAVSLEGREFPGARAISSPAPAKTLVGLRMPDRSIPRHEQDVRSQSMTARRPIGRVT